MLLTRVITASILAPFIIWTVVSLSNTHFAILWGLVVLLCAWEWSNLAGLKSIVSRLVYLVVIIVSLLPFIYWLDIVGQVAVFFDSRDILKYSVTIDWFAVPAVVLWFVASILLKNRAPELLKSRPTVKIKLIVGWFVLVTALVFFIRLRNFHGWEFALYLLFLIWMADISAYFFGRAFGRTKLSPISPGKTVAGMWGGMLAAILMAVVAGFYYGFLQVIWADFVLLSLVTVLLSICGDLTVSLAKRWRGVKDSGTILPGHGGMLDRLDSLIAAIPVFYTGIILMYEGTIT